jgi:hypothetical protein
VDASGNVGVGVTPAARLHVYGTYGYFQDGTYDGYFGKGNGVVVGAGASDLGISTATGAIAFGTGASLSERLRITSAGLVGVGVSAPQATLDVHAATAGVNLRSTTGANYALVSANNGSGSIRLGVESSAGGSLLSGASAYSSILCSSSNHALQLGTNATAALTIDTSQRVGIGVTSPARTLDVNGSIQLPSNNALYISGSNNYLYADSSATELTSATLIKFVTNSTERLRITSAGLVGVGTSSPQSQLQVLDQIRVSNSTQSQGSLVLGDGGSTAFNVGIARWNGGTNAAGAGGIGYFSQGTGNTGGHYFYTGDTGAGAQTARMVILPGGNVGIGTSTPTQLLTVIGSSFVGSSFNGQAIGDGSAERIRIGYKDGNPDTGLVPAQILTDATTLSIAARDVANSAIRFHTGSGTTERARIDSSGRLGIGTSSPSTNLHIGSGSGTGLGVLLSRGVTTNFFEAHDGTKTFIGGTDNTNAFVKVGSLSNHPVAIVQGNASAIYIDTSQRVGIGTTSPSTYNANLAVYSAGGAFVGALHANTGTFPKASAISLGSDAVSYTYATGGTTVALTGSAHIAALQSASTGAGTDIAFMNTAGGNVSERLRITSAGLVGVGTSSPTENLTIYGNSSRFSVTGLTGSSAILLGNQNSVGANNPSVIEAANGALYFGGGNSWSGGGTFDYTMTLTDDNKVGIGTTTASETLHVAGNALIAGTSQSTLTVGSSSFAGPHFANVKGGGNSLNFGYQLADTPRLYSNTLDANQTTIASNNSNIVFMQSAGGSERGRWDPSGRLLVGTSSARTMGTIGAPALFEVESSTNASLSATRTANDSFASTLVLAKVRGTAIVSANDEVGLLSFEGHDGTAHIRAAAIAAQIDGTPGTNDMPGRLVFSTTADGASSPTERMRINNDGLSNIFSSTNAFISSTSQGAGTAVRFYSGRHSATGADASGTETFLVWSNGNVQNTNASYGAISDVKLKENVVDASSQWDDIKALRVRKYNFKEGQTHTQIGVIAQEVEQISPGLVTESPDKDEAGNDLGTTTKAVQYSVLYMKAVKALQEAMERIETLEAKVAALESA